MSSCANRVRSFSLSSTESGSSGGKVLWRLLRDVRFLEDRDGAGVADEFGVVVFVVGRFDYGNGGCLIGGRECGRGRSVPGSPSQLAPRPSVQQLPARL